MKTQLQSKTVEQIATIYTMTEPVEVSPKTISGALIAAIISEYGARYTVDTSLDFAWYKYTAATAADFWKAYNTMLETYVPINNYDMTETTTTERHDGTVTRTRATDAAHNTIITAIEQDITVDTTADGTNKPTTKHYTTTYDSAATNRLASYDETTGKSTQHTTTAPNKNTSTVSDDLTETHTESHTPTSATVNGSSITADYIEGITHSKSGNAGVTSTQELITAELILRTKTVLYEYIQRFIDRYTFLCGGVSVEYDDDII